MTKLYNTILVKNNRKSLRKSMTEEEVILWAQLKGEKLGYKFRRQFGIGNYIADFYCPDKKLVIELDGVQHLDNIPYDMERENFMKSLGIQTLRFWNKDIRENLNGVIMIICENFNLGEGEIR